VAFAIERMILLGPKPALPMGTVGRKRDQFVSFADDIEPGVTKGFIHTVSGIITEGPCVDYLFRRTASVNRFRG
jgi:hypothetical protein